MLYPITMNPHGVLVSPGLSVCHKSIHPRPSCPDSSMIPGMRWYQSAFPSQMPAATNVSRFGESHWASWGSDLNISSESHPIVQVLNINMQTMAGAHQHCTCFPILTFVMHLFCSNDCALLRFDYVRFIPMPVAHTR